MVDVNRNLNVQSFGTKLINADGTPTSEFFTLLEGLVALETISGEGNPEGNGFAREKTRYWDELTNEIYFKTTGQNVSTGWVLES